MKYEITSIRLKESMNENQITAQELSVRSGVSKASISQYYNGSHKPSNIAAGKIGKILKVNPLWLMGFDVGKEIEEKIELPTEFSPEHIELINLYSKLNKEQQQSIMTMLRSFSLPND